MSNYFHNKIVLIFTYFFLNCVYMVRLHFIKLKYYTTSYIFWIAHYKSRDFKLFPIYDANCLMVMTMMSFYLFIQDPELDSEPTSLFS